MKFYVLYHPTKGYITSKNYVEHFTDDVAKAKKYTRKSDASQTVKYSYMTLVRECEVRTVSVHTYTEFNSQGQEVSFGINLK